MLVHQRVSLKYGTKKSPQNQPDEPPTIQNPPAGRGRRAAARGAWRAPSAGGLSVETWLADGFLQRAEGLGIEDFTRVLTEFEHVSTIVYPS